MYFPYCGSFKNCSCYFKGGEHRGSRKDEELFFLSTKLVLHYCIIVTNYDKLSSLKLPQFTIVKSRTQRLKELCFGSHKAEIKVLVTLGFYQEAVEKTPSDFQVWQNLVLCSCRTEVSIALLAVCCGSFSSLRG